MQGSRPRRRILILGLDGASLDLIEPWVASGDLPNLGRLMERGVSGPLLSTLPPATFPAWTSFATGTNPGRHGIVDFSMRVPGTYRVRFLNATHRRAPSLWGIASAAGLRVGVLAVPGTYPPEPVNGFMVAGFDCPVATRIDGRFVTPRALWREIERDWGGFRITDFQEVRTEGDWHATALPLLVEAARRKGDLAATLLSRERWDLFMVLFGESDTVAHHFWMFHDPRSPRHDPSGARRLGDAIRRVYRALDEQVGRLVALAGEETVVAVASDHGSGGAGAKVVHLNRWLAENGWLEFEGEGRGEGHGGDNGSGRAGPGAVHGLKRMALDRLPAGAQEALFRFDGGRLAGLVESASRLGGIRWARTRAYSEELNYAPSLWLNLAGREPKGIVQPGRDYERTRDGLIAAIEGLCDPDTGNRIVKRAWRREEAYRGPSVERAPDILIEPELDAGYSYSFLSSRGPGAEAPVRRLDPSEHVGAKGRSMNGSHRREGTFVAAGPGIAPGRIVGARIEDLAPTILAFLGLRATAHMDGKVLPIGAPPPSSRPAEDEGDCASHPFPAETDYSAAEERAIQVRLAAFGYIEDPGGTGARKG